MVIRIRKSKKNRQHNGEERKKDKSTNNDLVYKYREIWSKRVFPIHVINKDKNPLKPDTAKLVQSLQNIT